MHYVSIRPARVDDIPYIVEVRLAALTQNEIRGFSAAEFAVYSSVEKLRGMWDRENVLNDGVEVFVAKDDESIVGFIAVKVEPNAGYIDNLVVAKEERGKGIGRSLVAYAEHISELRGCPLMKTDTTENAQGVAWKAYGFWIRLGYVDTGERLRTNYDFKEIPLVKRLNPLKIVDQESTI
jgi:ribosomal protein S18 acetylase RimI-like enzyme